MTTLFTIGHSTRTWDEFLELLQLYGITHLVDVRTIPKSRRFPWFNQATMRAALKSQGIVYKPLPELGGLRHAHKDSINTGWRNASFRGFADYMQTMPFFLALKELNKLLKNHKVAIMCAEAVPWRCHRSLISDAEIVRGVRVMHILSKTGTQAHELTEFAVVDKSRRPIKIYYPK